MNTLDSRTVAITKTIERIITEIPGWTPPDQLLALFTLAMSVADQQGDVVEIGSWCGRSAAVIGRALQSQQQSKLHAVDLYPNKSDWYRNEDGSYSLRAEIDGKHYDAYQTQTVWQEPFERDIVPIYYETENLLERFKETMVREGLESVVTPYRGDLASFIKSRGASFKCKLAFVDGDHSYDAVASDIRLVDKVLIPGGWICFDDAFSSYDGVNGAITDGIIRNSKYGFCRQLTRKLFVAQKKRNNAVELASA